MKPPRPPSRRCPHPDCPSNQGRTRPRVVLHSTFRTRSGKRRRLLCKTCGRTFVRTLGTPYYRMRRTRRSFDRVARLLVEGVAQAGIARSESIAPSTVSRWAERAARHARLFSEHNATILDPVELQVDELKSFGARDEDRTWIFNGIEVWSRMWIGTYVGRRTRRSTLLFTRGMARTLPAPQWATLVTSDDFKYYGPVLRRTMGPRFVHVQVKNRYARGRILRSRARLVSGSERMMELAQERSEDSKRPNTSYVERLHLFLRRACAYLHRRTPSPMRKPQRLAGVLEVLRCYYNFIKPHSSLRFGRVTRTPAMQAGICARPLTFREVFSTVFPVDERAKVAEARSRSWR